MGSMPSSLGLYELLRVSPNASSEEIKKAFRKQARLAHPDLNPNDPNSEARFKEIQKAYEILSDPSSRLQYDKYGASYLNRGLSNQNRTDIKTVFEQAMVMWQEYLRPQKRVGEHLRVYISISLENAYNGMTYTVDYNKEIDCPQCRGTGALDQMGKKHCPSCEGLGELAPKKGSFLNFKRPCSKCSATGYVIVNPCTKCLGKGRSKDSANVTIKIPKGVHTGQRLRVKEYGNDGYLGEKSGDLFVIVHVQDHKKFRREKDNLHAYLAIKDTFAVTGGNIVIDTLLNRVNITIPPRVDGQKILRLSSEGMPIQNDEFLNRKSASSKNEGRGDLFLKLIICNETKWSNPEANWLLPIQIFNNTTNI